MPETPQPTTLRPNQNRYAAVRVDAYWRVIDRLDPTNVSRYMNRKADAVGDATQASRRWRDRAKVTYLGI